LKLLSDLFRVKFDLLIKGIVHPKVYILLILMLHQTCMTLFHPDHKLFWRTLNNIGAILSLYTVHFRC